jgi:hypothetical protein
MVAGMTAQHTPEPWVAGFGLIEESEEMMFGIGLPTLPTWTPIAILSTQRKLNATDAANAERIVTCVNACAGISNEALQQKGMSLLTDIIKNQQTTIESLRQQLASRDAEIAYLQSRIDELMLEYCPDEMTKEQLDNWAAHQRPVGESELPETIRARSTK